MSQPYIIAPAQGSDQADEWHRLGVESHAQGNLPQAQQRYQQALRLDPRHALVTQNLAIVFAQSSQINEALLIIERAEIFNDTHPLIKINYALMALEAGRVDVALKAATAASQLDANDKHAMLVMAMVLVVAGQAEAAMPYYNKMLDVDPKHPMAGPNACFIQTLTSAGPEELLKQRKRWWDANHQAGTGQQFYMDTTPGRPLRVGYVGGDFKCHSAAFIFGRVVLHHTPNVVPYLYSSLAVDPAKDHRTKAFQDAAGDRWRDITTVTDEDAEKLIRKDKIDILVDLAAHTNGGRLAIFTRKPAPIQVTAWGFAHGTGCPEIDYFLADPVAVPEAERCHYAEKVLDLPCIVTLESPEEYQLKGVSHPPLRKNGYITFGAYARYEKMSDQCLQTFAEILRRVPDSRLEFKDNAYSRPFCIRRVLAIMPDIEPERLLFSLATNHSDHMLAYQQADLILDPFPHTGGVVGLEQLYMGVPMVTLYGTQAGGRSTSSLLTVLNRADWIAKTTQEYVDIAVRMAEDTKMLAAQRKILRDDLLKSPIVVGYVEHVEALYRQMWQTWCDK